MPNAAGVVTVVSLGAVHNDHGVLGTAAVGQEVPSDAVVASRPDAEGAGACKEGDAAPSRVSEWPAPLRAAPIQKREKVRMLKLKYWISLWGRWDLAIRNNQEKMGRWGVVEEVMYWGRRGGGNLANLSLTFTS